MAQFGSALPWGGRGRKFKSCHSDQKKQIHLMCVCFFVCDGIELAVCFLPPHKTRSVCGGVGGTRIKCSGNTFDVVSNENRES